MIKKKFHIGKNGPAICNATKRVCRYGESSHYSTIQEAEKIFESKLLKDNSHSIFKTVVKQKTLNLNKGFLSKFTTLKDISAEDCIKIGKLIETEAFKIAKLDNRFDASEETGIPYTYEELQKLSSSISEVLKKEFPSKDEEVFNVEIFGTHSKALKESIDLLPLNAQNRLLYNIYTKTLNINNQSQDGNHISSTTMPKDIISTLNKNNNYGNIEVGDFIIDEKYTNEEELLDKNLIGLSLHKVISNNLEVGFSILPLLQKLPSNDQKVIFIELLKEKFVNINGEILPGKLKSTLKNSVIKELAEKNFITKEFYMGKPSSYTKKFNKVKKISDTTVIKLSSGEEVTLEKPTYEILKLTKVLGPHTIKAKHAWTQGEDGYKSILFHEFSHAIQSDSHIPGEKEIFNKLQLNKVHDEQDYVFYKGFPDSYMGLENGRELLTRASEGVFCPEVNDYLFNGVGENKETVRHWVIGVWASLSSNLKN